MSAVLVHLVEGVLSDEYPAWSHTEGNGALFVFEGVVRPIEGEREIVALDYEVYEPMTSRQLIILGEDVLEKHGLMGLCVEHSYGVVPVGGCSFRLRIASKHRREGVAGLDEFIDRMKQDVPIWKKPVYADD